MAECIEKMPSLLRSLFRTVLRPRDADEDHCQATPHDAQLVLYLRLRRIRRELMECIDQATDRQDPA